MTPRETEATKRRPRRPRGQRLAALREIGEFFWVRRKFWLLPIVVFLVLFGIFAVFTQSSALAPFIYALF
jgi:hypothetical protein